LIAQRLVQGGLVDGEQLTTSGLNLATEARESRRDAGQEVIRPLVNPLKSTGGLVILKGNLSPEGCVVKMAGHERLYQRGPARVFDAKRTRWPRSPGVR